MKSISFLILICSWNIKGIICAEDFIPIERIPGTGLFTGVYYTFESKQFPKSLVAWDSNLSESNVFRNTLKIVNLADPSVNPETLWTFEPVGKTGYFFLRNKKAPSLLIVSKVNKETGYHYPFLLEKSEASVAAEVLIIKPVKSTQQGFYLLKGQNVFTKDMITATWTNAGEGNNILIPQNPSKNETETKKEDLMFKLIQWGIDLEGTITHLEYNEPPQMSLLNDNKNVKRTELRNFILENNSTTRKTEVVTETFDTENIISLTFNENFKAFRELKVFNLDTAASPSETKARRDEISPKIKTFKINGSSNKVTDKEIVKATITNKVDIGPLQSVDVSVYKDTLSGVHLPFSALMFVQGQGDRILRDHSGVRRDLRPLSADLVMELLKEAGFDLEGVQSVQDSTLVWVSGILDGVFDIEAGFFSKPIENKLEALKSTSSDVISASKKITLDSEDKETSTMMPENLEDESGTTDMPLVFEEVTQLLEQLIETTTSK